MVNKLQIKNNKFFSKYAIKKKLSLTNSLERTKISNNKINKENSYFNNFSQKNFQSQKNFSVNNFLNFCSKKKMLSPPKNFKTELCKNYKLYKYCNFGPNCFFAHGKNELRQKKNYHNFYKTKICKKFHDRGFCTYGQRCQYYHFKCNKFYQEILKSFCKKNFISNENNPGLNFFKFLNDDNRICKRLAIFQMIFKTNDDFCFKEKFFQ